MIEPITQERWERAQIAEAAWMDSTQDNAESNRRAYRIYFRYLGMSFEQENKHIVEVGCSAFPAISYCQNVGRGTIVEPLDSANLSRVVAERGFYWIKKPLEDIPQKDLPSANEVWLLNVMQHIRDPELFVLKCKQMAPVIRFFEPIDFGVSEPHPHTYTIADFVRWFGRAERYRGGSDEGFHTADCAYGTWTA